MSNSSVTHVLVSEQIGGAALLAMALARRLVDRGTSVRVFVPGAGQASERLHDEGVRFVFYNKRLLVSRASAAAALGNLFLGLRLKSWQRQVVHFHVPALYAAARHALGRCLSVVHIHSEEPSSLLQWACRRPPDLIVPCARFMVPGIRAALPAQYQESQQIESLPNAVDVDRFAAHRHVDRRAAKEAIGATSGLPLVVMAANLAPLKGQTTAIRALGKLKAQNVAVDLWLAGEDREKRGYERELEELARRERVADRVRFLGFRSDIERLYAAADIVLLPSASEGLPLTLLEAQAAGVPVLAAPVGGIPEIVEDGKTGWLIAADDADGYANRIKTLLENPDLRRAVADRAYERVRANHNLKEYCNRMIELYDRLLRQ
jgi:glycosyltransferase involved in cell wall biosynthesis